MRILLFTLIFPVLLFSQKSDSLKEVLDEKNKYQMKKIIYVLTVFLINIGTSFGADNYEIGDSLYVWARSGLNVRTGPSTNHSILSKINSGEKIFIEEKSDFTYNIKGISKIGSYLTESVEPLIFYGNWVKIRTESGIVGFVIDQYLIDLEPKKRVDLPNMLFLTSISSDTINSRTSYEGIYEYTTKTIFKGNITSVASFGGYSQDETWIFENYTFEEVLIIFSSLYDNYKDFVIMKNWEKELYFLGDGICSFRLKKDGDKIIFYTECSC